MEIISTNNAPKALGPYSQAVKVGSLVFISGQVPINPETGIMAIGIKEQTIQVMKNIAAIIEAVDVKLSFTNLVKTTIYLKDMNNFTTVNEAYGSFFKDTFPARATIEVARLPKDAMVEIEAVLCIN